MLVISGKRKPLLRAFIFPASASSFLLLATINQCVFSVLCGNDTLVQLFKLSNCSVFVWWRCLLSSLKRSFHVCWIGDETKGGGRGAVCSATRLFPVSSTRLWSCSGTWTWLLSCEGFSNLPHDKPSADWGAFFRCYCCCCNFKYQCRCVHRPEACRCRSQNVTEIRLTGTYT